MVTAAEKAAAYLQQLEADRLAAITASQEKAQEAMLIKARQEGFQEAMKLFAEPSKLFAEPLPMSAEPKRNEARRRKRRNIKQLILTELSFSGNAVTTNQIAGAIDYILEGTENALKGLERSGQVVRDQDGRWTLPVTTAAQPEVVSISAANGKSSVRNGAHREASR